MELPERQNGEILFRRDAFFAKIITPQNNRYSVLEFFLVTFMIAGMVLRNNDTKETRYNLFSTGSMILLENRIRKCRYILNRL